ncbi:DUF3221 domain-containing protein [Neobacillus sp. K501]
MKKRVTVTFVLVSLVLMIAGCSINLSSKTKKSDDKKITDKNLDEEINDEAVVEGEVTKLLSENGFLLEVTKGNSSFAEGTLVNISINNETIVNSLEEGQNVRVWHGGKILESYPPQTKGLKIEIIDKEE